MEGMIIKINYPEWNIEEETGYKPITTFWQDFSIADKFGIPSIKDTYNRAFNEWKGNYKYITELVLVLNHKIWQHYNPNAKSNPIAEVYNNLWEGLTDWVYENLKGEELDYFYNITD